jgi:hypothetical protein
MADGRAAGPAPPQIEIKKKNSFSKHDGIKHFRRLPFSQNQTVKLADDYILEFENIK